MTEVPTSAEAIESALRRLMRDNDRLELIHRTRDRDFQQPIK
jgi:ribosomal protein S21